MALESLKSYMRHRTVTGQQCRPQLGPDHAEAQVTHLKTMRFGAKLASPRYENRTARDLFVRDQVRLRLLAAEPHVLRGGADRRRRRRGDDLGLAGLDREALARSRLAPGAVHPVHLSHKGIQPTRLHREESAQGYRAHSKMVSLGRSALGPRLH